MRWRSSAARALGGVSMVSSSKTMDRFFRGTKIFWRRQAALRLDLHASQLETQMAQARLGALKAQLQPHFLFNTLNAIVVLVRQQKGQQAEETLARFSELLRAVLADMDVQEVTLARELEYLKLYLSIEELRFSTEPQTPFSLLGLRSNA